MPGNPYNSQIVWDGTSYQNARDVDAVDPLATPEPEAAPAEAEVVVEPYVVPEPVVFPPFAQPAPVVEAVVTQAPEAVNTNGSQETSGSGEPV